MPPWLEFALVVSAAFGPFIVTSIVEIPRASEPYAVSWADFMDMAMYEIAVGMTLACLLAARGWRLADFGIDRPRLADLGVAHLLLGASYAVAFAVWFIVPNMTRQAPFGGFRVEGSDFDVLTLFLFPVVNATYEEVFVCAYVLSFGRRLPMWDAITISAGIRLAYHLYQGPLAVITIGPLGLIFAWYYATRGRLWPLIIAHIVADAVPMLAMYEQARVGSS
jgi:membrane protease YdiL (CAAX protease family)